MNDNQAWNADEKEHIHTIENEDQPSDETIVNPEAGQVSPDAVHVQQEGMQEEKTVETWKTSYPAPIGRVNIENPELLGSEEISTFRNQWNEIQAKFVDEPGASVRQADALVAEVMGQVTQRLTNQRRVLEGQWNLGDTSQGEASTEDLRQILQSYRAFFNRLLK
jgi:hypothetical protein